MESPKNIIIGIDPDVDKSGVAIKQKGHPDKTIQMTNLPLWDVFDYLLDRRETVNRVFIEAGWLNAKSLAFKKGARRAVDVGRNHSIGQQIEKFCAKKEIPYGLVRPKGAKWNHETLVRFTKINVRSSNSEQRDAVRLIVGR